jgi:hypothetical protein
LSGADGGTLRLQAFFELHQIGHGARKPVELGANQPIARTAKVDRRVKLRALGIDARELLAEYLLDACGLEVDTGTPNGRLMFNVIASIAQFEREVMLARRREGIAKAKSEGKYRAKASTKAGRRQPGRNPVRYSACFKAASAQPRLQSSSASGGARFTASLRQRQRKRERQASGLSAATGRERTRRPRKLC